MAHVLAELPKQYTENLLGDNTQRVKDLDAAIWAIDFDDGPAEFWLKTRETGPKTFPVRLPTSEKETWKIPKAKAHILIWIQPSHWSPWPVACRVGRMIPSAVCPTIPRLHPRN